MKTCCDEYCSNYGCNQGDDCPVRTGKPYRKVKAGGPPPADMPVQFAEPEPDEPGPSLVTVALWAATAFCAVMAGLNLIFGGWR